LIAMLDIAASQKAMAQIEIGQPVDIFLENVKHSYPVLLKTLYSVTVQTPTNRLTVPVEMTAPYRKEMKMRLSQEQIAIGQKPGPGRPKGSRAKAGPQAPVANPAQPDPQPPATRAMPPGWPPQPPHQAQQPAQPAASPAQEGGADPLAWATDQIDTLFTQARADVLTMIEAIIADFGEAADAQVDESEPPPVKKTCADCEHGNLATGMCDKFQMVPPMFVMINAKEKCIEFQPCEAPF